MKRLDSFLLVVVAVFGLMGGGGCVSRSESSSVDPTDTTWEFLVSMTDRLQKMLLTFSGPDNLQGAAAKSGSFRAVLVESGATIMGTWSSSGDVVTGTSAGVFRFALTINADGKSGIIDYVTESGAGSALATKVETPPSGCSQYAGNWEGTGTGTDCQGLDSSNYLEAISIAVESDCSATACLMGARYCEDGQVVDDTVSFTFSVGQKNCSPGTMTLNGSFRSSSSIRGTVSGAITGIWSATKQ